MADVRQPAVVVDRLAGIVVDFVVAVPAVEERRRALESKVLFR